MSRGRKGVFSRDNSEDSNVSQPDWFKEYSSNLQKLSVQPAHKDRAFFDQITDILGNKSRYATVEEAVKDLQDRTGLAKYLQMCEAEQAEVTKVAQDINDTHVKEPKTEEELEVTLDPDSDEMKYPKLLQDHPEIKKFIENFVKSRNGFVHVPAVVESIRIIFRNDNFTSDELEDKHLRKFINEVIIKEKALHEGDNAGIDIDLGKLDHSTDTQVEENNDAFSILMPAKL
jgi:hypothetical protein